MSNNIVNMEDYIKDNHFNQDVLPFFQMMNTSFEYTIEDDTCLFTLLYKSDFLYVFLEYVPRNQFTEKPTVLDRFFNVKIDPRTSHGEWVVTKLFEIGSSYHKELQILRTDENSKNYIESVFKELER